MTSERERADALTDAYRRGAEDMRERAAMTADDYARTRNLRWCTGRDIAIAIRSLPIPDGDGPVGP